MQVKRILILPAILCLIVSAQTKVLAQHSSYITYFGADTLKIKYTKDGKDGVIYELHKIPSNSFPIPNGTASQLAQNPTDTINLSTLNYRLLDSLVWVECNNYRAEKGLDPVAWNDTIYAGSAHHSEYQAYYNIIGHGETESMPGREEQQKHYNTVRVFAAEICLLRYCYAGQTTYGELAKTMIQQWKDSPGHNAIMITPDYKLNAFASAFRFSTMSSLTRENLLKYNPALLKKIETAIPNYFWDERIDSTTLCVWCTGNFVESPEMKSEMNFVKHATVTHNADGTTTYSGGMLYPSNNHIEKAPVNNGASFTREEEKEIRKCNTAKFSFLYMGKQSREFIKMMNLCRKDGPLFYKYVYSKYGDDYASQNVIRQFENYHKTPKRTYLRPSFGLHLSALFHAIASGITGYEGHRWLDFRILAFMNFNTLFGRRYRGENCDYGSRKAIDCIVDLLGSAPHRANILNRDYMRVGVASFPHSRYGYNQVSTFTGPKLMDEIFHRKDLKK